MNARDVRTYYVAAAGRDQALAVAWNERMTPRADNPNLALHPDDIPPRWKDEYGFVYRVSIGAESTGDRIRVISEAVQIWPPPPGRS